MIIPSPRSLRLSAIGMVLLLYILSLLVRLPNLNRPVSKHYEFNTAVILINIISWRQAGGGHHFYYTPVMNFQHTGDKLPPDNLYVDRDGNSVYLSFGPGWYIIPYFVYQFLGLPAEPVYLEILNLVIHLITVLLFFYLLERLIPVDLDRRYFIITAGCCFMIFSPGMLWFMGNGYVNTELMLPFVLGVFLLLIPLLQDPGKITAGRLTFLGMLIILLVYIDWYIIFLSFLCSILVLFKSRQNKRYLFVFFTFCVAVTLGTALIFFQFSSHMGREAVIHYWLGRFSDRGLTLAGTTLVKRFAYLPAYFISSFLPLMILLLAALLSSWRAKIFPRWSLNELLFIRIFSVSLIIYNFILFKWSTDHEFTVIPWSILLSFVAARYLGSLADKSRARAMLVIFVLISICQYYWINRPGLVSRDGMHYANFRNLGRSLEKVPPDYAICINLEQNPMVEYYAGRNIFRFPDSLAARKGMDELGIQKAVWITQKNYQVGNIQIIR